MQLPDEQGRPRQQVLEMWSKRKRQRHPDLDAPAYSPAFDYLLKLYRELDSRRATAGPLSWSEIDAWLRVTGRALSRSELGAVLKLDSAMLGEVAAHRDAQRAQQQRRQQKGTTTWTSRA